MAALPNLNTAEWLLILITFLIVISASSGDLRNGIIRGMDELRKVFREVENEIEKSSPPPSSAPVIFRFRTWIAQGLGVGRIPLAPGTFGSVAGLLWFAILLADGKWWFYLVGCGAGVALSVWFCGQAEKLLGQKDPGSVVLDEIIAIPFCFLSWLAIFYFHNGHLPDLQLVLFTNWQRTVGIFLLFRLFDVAKPWPVKQSQSLPGGWGVTIDDLLAAVYVNAVVLGVWVVKGFLH